MSPEPLHHTVLRHLHRQGMFGITQQYAYRHLHHTRLAASIHTLREQGCRIRTIMETSQTADGRTARYARYVLESMPTYLRHRLDLWRPDQPKGGETHAG